MIDEELIEKIARAICEDEGFSWENQRNYSTSASGGDDETEHYFSAARAAIKAIDLPSIKSADRAQALEEAAKVAEDYPLRDYGQWKGNPGREEIAAAIRALAEATK